MAATLPWPSLIRLNAAKDKLEVVFDTGKRFEFPAEYLRVYSQSAEVTGHGVRPRAVVAGKRRVKILDLQAMGNYAVRIVFDDGHDTGLYSWDYFHELGANQQKKWAAYLEELAARGLKRD
jgi:DUF971 family protein